MDLGIKGKSALVTGGSKGIGYASAKLMLQAGAKVTICARNEAQLTKARDELAKVSPDVQAVVADMTKKSDIESLIKKAADKFGSVQILLNNAGEMHTGHFDSMTEERLQLQFDTKIYGYMRAIRLVFPGMKEKKWGRIVNIIGGAGKQPEPVSLGSSMTNAALLALTKALSNDWGKHNVLVNAVCPGYIETDNWTRNMQGLLRDNDFQSKSEAELRVNAPKYNNSMARWGQPEELAQAVLFLSSEACSFINGMSINVDGGRLKSLW
ncbi:MAG: SDR family oxidoreductase [Pseudolabrys sp.]|nr:SDR family oxidoreductase [Pseudolabrys sp.]